MLAYRDVMLDLETMGNGPDAAIVAIGAVCFSAEERDIGSTFYAVVDLASSVEAGGCMDASTVMWWLNQSDNARQALLKKGGTIAQALKGFGLWINAMAGEDAIVWGNGAGFDNVILASAYNRLKMPVPWRHFNNRCFRTLKNLRPDIKAEQSLDTKHHALADARAQALHAVQILARIELGVV